jgi:hypothetical protein
LPSRSKAQQKFMGMVHALKKGEMKPSDASPEVKKAADSMTKKSTKKYASTKHKGKPERVSKEVVKKLGEMIKQEVAKRDYKAEYKKFQSSTKMKKYRAELNKYNRQKGTYGNGDGKDASHKGGKIVGFESQSKNRGRAEKSRLKKENLGKRCTVKEVSKWLKTLEEFRYRKVRPVDARRVASFVNNGMNEEELPMSLQKKWEHKKYGREKHLAGKFIETFLKKESVNEIFPKGAGRKISKAMQKGKYKPEKRRKPRYGEVEVMKGKGSRQSWFYLKTQNDVKQLIRLGRNSAFPTGITKNNSKLKFDKGLHIKESVNEAVEPRGNIKKVLDVAKNKQAKKIGGTLVDGTTANMMTQVWNKVNDSSKEKMNKMNTKQLINLILRMWKAMGTPRV